MYPRFLPELKFSDISSALLNNVSYSELGDLLSRKVLGSEKGKRLAFFNSGRGAIYHILKQLNVKKVYVQGYICCSVYKAIQLAKKEIIPLDITLRNYGIDVDTLENKLEEGSVIILSHLYGIPCDIEDIKQIARQKKCIVIEDACAAYGSSYRGIPVGNFGDIAVISFDFSKTLTASRGGAAVLNNNKYGYIFDQFEQKVNDKFIDLYSIKALTEGVMFNVLNTSILYKWLILNLVFKKNRPYTDSGKYDLVYDTYFNKGISGVRRSILYRQLMRFNKICQRKREIGELYYKELSNVNTIHLFECNKNEMPILITFPFLLKEKDRLKVYHQFKQKGVDLGWSYSYILGNSQDAELTNCFYASERMLNLPLYSKLSVDDAGRIIEITKRILS